MIWPWYILIGLSLVFIALLIINWWLGHPHWPEHEGWYYDMEEFR